MFVLHNNRTQVWSSHRLSGESVLVEQLDSRKAMKHHNFTTMSVTCDGFLHMVSFVFFAEQDRGVAESSSQLHGGGLPEPRAHSRVGRQNHHVGHGVVQGAKHRYVLRFVPGLGDFPSLKLLLNNDELIVNCAAARLFAILHSVFAHRRVGDPEQAVPPQRDARLRAARETRAQSARHLHHQRDAVGTGVHPTRGVSAAHRLARTHNTHTHTRARAVPCCCE